MGVPVSDMERMFGYGKPASKLIAITPHNDTDLSGSNIRALWIGGAGNVSVIATGDTAEVTLSGIPAGTLLAISVKRVRATGTTATLIVGLS